MFLLWSRLKDLFRASLNIRTTQSYAIVKVRHVELLSLIDVSCIRRVVIYFLGFTV